ncbi:MAG: hypothetical protein U0326_16925 [Polyangiales bacterium]
MTRRLDRRASLAALCAALGSCEPDVATQLLVRVDSDLSVPASLDAIVVRTRSNGRTLEERRFALGAGSASFSLPGTFGVVPSGDASRAATVEIDAMLGSCTLFTRRVTAPFVEGRVTSVDVFLSRDCAGHLERDRCVTRDVCGRADLACTRGGACVATDIARATPVTSPRPRPEVVPTNGGAVVITPDDAIAVAANRRANSVSVFDLDLGPARSVARRATLTPPNADASGRDPEAWAVVAGNDSDAAYVALRREQRVARIDDLRGAPHFAAESAPTGSEPTGIAITPSGRHLYVANFNEGTVTVIATATMHVEMTLDLNGVLARSGRLGPSVTPRPALAHPRAVVITNHGHGDDREETAYVTEFYAQSRDPASITLGGRRLDPDVDPEYWDLAREGVVYRIPLDTNVPDERLLTIAPVEDAGFSDAATPDGGPHAGCFPNQLYSAQLNGGRLYVTGICASPRGPVGERCRAGVACALPPDEDALDPGNFKTLAHAAVFALDPSQGATTGSAVILTDLFRRVYDLTLPGGVAQVFRPEAPVPDDARRRMPLVPLGVAFVPGDYAAYVLGYGSNAVFRLHFSAAGALDQAGSPSSEGFINLTRDAGALRGELPIGIAIGHDDARRHTETALVLNAETLNLSVVNLMSQSVVGAVSAVAPDRVETPAEQRARAGRRLFVTGTGRSAWRGQAWSSCETCHPDGLSDGVTWFFPRGPRQTPSLDGSFALDEDRKSMQRLFGWMASFDEVQDVDTVVRNVMGGVGGLVHRASSPPRTRDRIIVTGERPTDGTPFTATAQMGLNGAAVSVSSPTATGAVRSVVRDLDDLTAYVASIRAPRRPVGLDPSDVEAGADLFAHSCAGCHGSALWSSSRRFYTPSEAVNATNGLLRTARYLRPAEFAAEINPASSRGSATYRYVGATAALDNANDSVQCALRAVGTFAVIDGHARPVAIDGAPVREVRQNMADEAQGAQGFSPPSLVGASLSAPYFHAGNARTLEELFATRFLLHHTTWCPNCFNVEAPRGRLDVQRIVAFLLSIDDDQRAPPVGVPDLGVDVDLCAAWRTVAP